MNQPVIVGDCTLYLGDCLQMDLTADAVITDPPYGMGWDTDSTRFSGGNSGDSKRKARGDGRSDYGAICGDDSPFDPVRWAAFPKAVLFGGNHFASRLPVGTTLIWVKKDE